MCNQRLSPLKFWVQTPFMVRCTWYNIMWKVMLVTCCRSVVFSGVSSNNQTDRHDITEILLKVTLNTINQTNNWSKSRNNLVSIFRTPPDLWKTKNIPTLYEIQVSQSLLLRFNDGKVSLNICEPSVTANKWYLLFFRVILWYIKIYSAWLCRRHWQI